MISGAMYRRKKYIYFLLPQKKGRRRRRTLTFIHAEEERVWNPTPGTKKTNGINTINVLCFILTLTAKGDPNSHANLNILSSFIMLSTILFFSLEFVAIVFSWHVPRKCKSSSLECFIHGNKSFLLHNYCSQLSLTDTFENDICSANPTVFFYLWKK